MIYPLPVCRHPIFTRQSNNGDSHVFGHQKDSRSYGPTSWSSRAGVPVLSVLGSLDYFQ